PAVRPARQRRQAALEQRLHGGPVASLRPHDELERRLVAEPRSLIIHAAGRRRDQPSGSVGGRHEDARSDHTVLLARINEVSRCSELLLCSVNANLVNPCERSMATQQSRPIWVELRQQVILLLIWSAKPSLISASSESSGLAG